MLVDPGQPMMEPLIGPGVDNVARTQWHMVFVFPHAFPAKAQMLHPDAAPAGSETNVTFTVGTVVSKGAGLPLKRTPACALVHR